VPESTEQSPDNQPTESAGASTKTDTATSTGDRSASDVWLEQGANTDENQTSTADGTSQAADSDGARLDDARLQSVADTDITVDSDGARLDDARLQGVADTDMKLVADGVREDEARLQSVRDDWDGVPIVTETHTPSGPVEFRGDLYSRDDKDRVMHPSDGVGYEFSKPNTDMKVLRDRIDSLPADIREALNRGDDDVRVKITASASRAGPPELNQDLTEARGEDMAKAMKELGVKSEIEVIPLGESRAAAAGAPDVDNPADRVATFEVEVTKHVPPPTPTETPDVELPKFEVAKTKAEAVSESIDKELKKNPFTTNPVEAAWRTAKMQWLGPASGYAGAAAEVAKSESRAGFAIGVVYAADGRTWEQTKDASWQKEPGTNTWDQNIAKAGQSSFNDGLVRGFEAGRDLSPGQREALWRELGRQLGPDLGGRGDPSNWSESDWKDHYREASYEFRKLHLD
jgi:outer membrane protein OmpA-like peptidoglycan-associated protein